jgi:integrase
MPVVNMTDRFVKTLKRGPNAVEWFDETTRGLSLKVNPGGACTFYFNYTRRTDAIRRRVQLGKAASLPLKEARRKALRMASLVADGKDPAGDRRAERDALTVADVAELYLKLYAETRKRTANRDRQAIDKDVLPVIGRLKAESVTRRDIGRITERMVARGVTIGASRTFEIVRKMFSWAIGHGLIERNPCQGMAKPFKTRERERVLSGDEIRTVWNGLDVSHISSDAQKVLQLCLITGQRLGEVAGMSRGELNLQTQVWTIPSSRSKNGHAHRVPLTEMALGIVEIASATAVTEFLFPGYGKLDPIRSSSVGKAVRRSQEVIGIPHWTTHDLRRTVATAMADLGVAPHVIGHVLNHRTVTRAKVTDRVYVRYDYQREVRAALELWQSRLSSIIAGEAPNVVPLVINRTA